jgi:hypothetical protein
MLLKIIYIRLGRLFAKWPNSSSPRFVRPAEFIRLRNRSPVVFVGEAVRAISAAHASAGKLGD